MAHKLSYHSEAENIPKRKQFNLPQFNGKIGFSLFFGTREVFIGIAIAEVEIERIVRKRILKTPKAGVRVFRFD